MIFDRRQKQYKQNQNIFCRQNCILGEKTLHFCGLNETVLDS